MIRFTSILVVSPLADGKTWVLMREFGYLVGLGGNATVIHDWLYWEQQRARGAADAILMEGMVPLG